MPSGHPDPTTIAARPLTPGMRAFLTRLERGPVKWADLTQGEKNQARALDERGLVDRALKGEVRRKS